VKRLVNLGLGLVLAIGLTGVAFATGGSQASVTGNLEDAYCYGSMGAKGPGHKTCAIKCASAGIPVVLIEKGTEKTYVLLPDKDASPLPPSVIQHMEDEVTVTGKEYNRNGTEYIVVESVK
jgi:hypothetical protein